MDLRLFFRSKNVLFLVFLKLVMFYILTLSHPASLVAIFIVMRFKVCDFFFGSITKGI